MPNKQKNRRHKKRVKRFVQTKIQKPQPLKIIAFSDCRVQDLDKILLWVQSRTPDLILYAGDDIARFRPDAFPPRFVPVYPEKYADDPESLRCPEETINYFEELADAARFGLCAVAGNDDEPSTRALIKGKKVFEVHSRPVEMKGWLIVGLEGVESSGRSPLRHPLQHSSSQIRRHLEKALGRAGNQPVILLSHTPPKGCADWSIRFGRDHIGSKALRAILTKTQNVKLVVCGHSHFSGGQTDQLGNAYVLNVASHDNDDAEPARMAEISIEPDGVPVITQTLLDEAFDSVVCISGIGMPTAERLDAVGLGTIKALSEADPSTIRSLVPNISMKPEVFVARARAHRLKQPVVFGSLKLPPAPRIYFDIETTSDLGKIWLIGCYSEKENKVFQFLAPTLDHEKRILKDFVDFAKAHPKASFISFSASHLDHLLTEKRLQYHGFLCPDSIKIKSSPNAYNAYYLLWESLAVPGRQFGLKEIAKTLGYSFKHPDLNGLLVAWEYEHSVSQGHKPPRKLLEYNEDDVRALHFTLMSAHRMCQQFNCAKPISETDKNQ
ncbi:MAG: ribonuclease H-like domain-containing protein [Nitrososphaera sp.]|nr:ribonuclease H-like domain-containing protein [Nitrososphaera sp.]